MLMVLPHVLVVGAPRSFIRYDTKIDSGVHELKMLGVYFVVEHGGEIASH